MKKDFETLNKQIAAFIIVSGAISAPAFADAGLVNTPGIMIQPAPQNEIVRYAGPGMAVPTIYQEAPAVADPNIMARYAGPGMSIPTISEPAVQDPPMVVKYAGPGMPIIKPSDDTDPSAADPLKQISDIDKLRMIDSTDNINVNSSEDEHEYGETKIAPGHFRFW